MKHRKFISFLEEMNTEYSNLPLYSCVRWLSAGKTLQHFFALWEDMHSFLQNEDIANSEKHQIQLQDEDFLCSLAFVTDVTAYLNVMNMNLQGKSRNISQLLGYVDALRRKQQLFNVFFKNN